jgi:ribose 5-phosphate isomerase A
MQLAARPSFSRQIRLTAAQNTRRTSVKVMAEMSKQDQLKQEAAWKAVDYVKSGMTVGLGTGSTAAFAVDRIGSLLKSGELKDIVAVPTSIATYEQAKGLGIPLATLDTKPKLDVAIDGADEVDPNLDVVKGRGGALLREKMVELASDKFVCIVDDSKLVSGLGGSKLAMPVEIVQFCHEYTLRKLQALPEVAGCVAKLRMSGDEPYVTDNSNYIVDLYFENEPIKDSYAAAKAIEAICGVVEVCAAMEVYFLSCCFSCCFCFRCLGRRARRSSWCFLPSPAVPSLTRCPRPPAARSVHGHGRRLHHRRGQRRRGQGEEVKFDVIKPRQLA